MPFLLTGRQSQEMRYPEPNLGIIIMIKQTTTLGFDVPTINKIIHGLDQWMMMMMLLKQIRERIPQLTLQLLGHAPSMLFLYVDNVFQRHGERFIVLAVARLDLTPDPVEFSGDPGIHVGLGTQNVIPQLNRRA